MIEILTIKENEKPVFESVGENEDISLIIDNLNNKLLEISETEQKTVLIFTIPESISSTTKMDIMKACRRLREKNSIVEFFAVPEKIKITCIQKESNNVEG